MRALAIAVLTLAAPAAAGPVVIAPYICGESVAIARARAFDGTRTALVEVLPRRSELPDVQCGPGASPNACSYGSLQIVVVGELELGAVYLAKIRPIGPPVHWGELACSTRAETVAVVRIPDGVATAIIRAVASRRR